MVYLHPSVHAHLGPRGVCRGCVAAHLHESGLAIGGHVALVALDVVLEIMGVPGHGPVVHRGGRVARGFLVVVILAAECGCGTRQAVVRLLGGERAVMEHHGICHARVATESRYREDGVDIAAVAERRTVQAVFALPCGGPCGVREIDVDDFGRGGRVAPLLYHGFGVETPRNRAPCGGYGCRQDKEGKDFLHGEIKGWRINGQGRPCWRRGLAECLCYVSGSGLFAGESLGALEILVIADARLGFEGRIILGQCLIDCGLGLVVFHLVEHGGLLKHEQGSVVGIVVRD